MIIRTYGNTSINRYYIQTLCMIFFPSISFGENEEATPETPILELILNKSEEGTIEVRCTINAEGRVIPAEKYYQPRSDITEERLLKIAVGDAVISCCGELFSYRPAWGILTGVRPSKVATELLLDGYSKTRVKKIFTSDYMVIPKKAALAVDVALNEMKIIGVPDKRDCSVYISIPFCPTRCAYCSFVSYTSKRLLDMIPDYLNKLTDEIISMFEDINSLGLKVKTVYIGGGTPTILNELQLDRLLSVISSCTDISKLEEFTLESGRPDTITAEKMKVAHSYGVNRVCVNPQILCDEVLTGIGRCHTTEDFFRAYDIARNSGIPIINTDLIAGLPGDNFPTFAESFEKILTLHPENITVHTLCIKRAADLRKSDKKFYSLRGGDTGKCVDYSQIKSIHEGYKPYYMYRQKNAVGNFENVGMSIEGCEGRYNIYMMEETHSIFAAGAGAVMKFTDYHPGDRKNPLITRYYNPKYPYEYMRNDKRKEKSNVIRQFYAEHNR